MAVRKVGEEGGEAPAGEKERSTGLPKLLASPNKKVRERAIKLLVAWLSAQKELKEVDLKKIWKGLFYCVWHTDKPPVQADLIQRLASLLFRLDIKISLQFFECFVSTMRREWGGIDKLRLDKFYLLIRKFLSSMFKVLHDYNWNVEWVAKFMSALMERLFLARDLFPTVGVSLHVADCFWSELKPFLPAPDEAFGCLLEPFYAILVQSPDKILLERVQETVFVSLLKEAGSIESSSEKGGKFECSLGFLAIKQPLAKRFFELAASSAVAQRNRKILYQLYEESTKLPKLQAGSKGGVLEFQSELGFDCIEKTSEGISQGSAKKKRRLDTEGSLKENDGMQSEAMTLKEDRSADVPANGSIEKSSGKKKQTPAKSPLKTKRTKEKKSPDNEGLPSSLKKRKSLARKSPEEELGIKTQVGAAFGISEQWPSLCNWGGLKSIALDVKSESTVGEETEVSTDGVSLSKLSKKLDFVSSDDPEESPGASFQPFARLSRSPQNTGSKKRRKPEVEKTPSQFDEADETCTFSASIGENKQQASGLEKKVKKVRFSLKHNIAWKPKSPLPPQSLRLPPSSTPRGSALKKGVPPGPIKVSTTPNMSKKNVGLRKFLSDSSLTSPRNLAFRRSPMFMKRLSSL